MKINDKKDIIFKKIVDKQYECDYNKHEQSKGAEHFVSVPFLLRKERTYETNFRLFWSLCI